MHVPRIETRTLDETVEAQARPASGFTDGVARLKPRFRLIVDDGTAGWAMVRDGLGLTWAPAWLGYEDLRSGRVVEVLRDARMPEIPLSAVGLQRAALTPRRSQVVLDAISEAAATWS